MHINEIFQMTLTLADGLGDIGIGSVYQSDTLTMLTNPGPLGPSEWWLLKHVWFPNQEAKPDAK